MVNRTEIEKKIDILEDDIFELDPTVLDILLKDKTTKKNILWCTSDYEKYGRGYEEKSQIQVQLITGKNSRIIQPRAAKSKKVQEMRIKNKAEVFTPSWICNEQNNQIDEAWFGRPNVFNTPMGKKWIVSKGKIEFGNEEKTWKEYVLQNRMEITCGEAPYLVSRYDTTTGELISICERFGIFDRKMRVVNENCITDKMWLEWSIYAVRSVYGYEFQGDSVLIARENLLYDYIDYYRNHFGEDPPIEILKVIADIISWNIWQMDGLRYVVPYSCHKENERYQISIFDVGKELENKYYSCPGCEKNDIYRHNGVYCCVFDWNGSNKAIPFIDVIREVSCGQIYANL